MRRLPTFLAPGQRYAAPHDPAWRAERQITIVHLGRDAGGATRVTYRRPGGNLLTTDTREFKHAVDGGLLVPLTGPGRVGRC